MDLTSPKTIKELLAKHSTKPLKGLGQNFLIDQATLKKIVEAADLKPTDTILEVGPGIGTLTQALAPLAKTVLAIEKDKNMVEILKETLAHFKNINVIHGDILKMKPQIPIANDQLTKNIVIASKAKQSNTQLPKKYKIVANIPYYLTSPLIRMFLESGNPPESMVLMVQKEVAQRICAKPPHMSILAVSVQFYAKAEIISYVGKEKFWPSPKVDSAIIKITPYSNSSLRSAAPAGVALWQSNNPAFVEKFFQIVKAGFSHPRKQLANNFSVILKKDRKEVEVWLSKNDIKSNQRAETLSIQNWINLTNSL